MITPPNTNPETPAPQPPAEKQYIPKEGEEYLRESGKIEDYPSQDDDDAGASNK